MTKLGKRRTSVSGFLMRTTALWCSAALVTVPFMSQAAMAADYTGTNGGRGGDAQWSDSGTQAGGAGGAGGTNGSGGTAAAGGGAGGAATGYMGGSGGAADGGGGGGVYNGAGRPGGGGGAGGAGYILSDGNSFTSSGNVTGGQGGDGGYSATSFGQFSYAQAGGGGGGGGGSGIIASGTATITNTNNITGGTGGAGQYSNYNVFNRGNVFADNGYNGAGGHGISAIGATGLTINNSGNITGGNAGYLLYGEPNSGGSGIYGQNITLYNTGGTIKGGIGTLDYAPGIRLTGGVNTLNMSGGAVTGTQNGDAIRVDNGTNIFNVSGGTIAADAGGIGLDIAAGNNTLTLSSGSISLNQSSTGLQVGGGTNTFNVTGGSFSQSSIYYNTAIVVNAGTNIFNASAGNILGGFQSNAVKLNNGTNTFNISGSANFNSAYVSDVFAIGGGINTLNISGGTVTPSQYGTYGINVSGGTNILNVTGGTVGRVYLGGGANTLEGSGFTSDVTLAHGATAAVTAAGGDVSGITGFDNHGGLSLDAGRSITIGAFTNESDGTLILGAGATLISTNLNLIAGSTITGAGSLSSGSAAYSLASGSISAALAGTGGLTKTGNGTLTLTGANSYTGGTNITGGTLAIAFGALGGGDVHMAEGTTIQFTGGSFTTSNSFFINGDPVFDVASGTQTINSVIADDTSAAPPVPGVVEKTGAGELLLTGANTYTGGTIISAGTLTVGVATVRDGFGAILSSAVGTGAVTLDGGTLSSNAYQPIYNAIQVNSTGGTLDSGAVTFEVDGNITNGTGGPGTLTIAGTSGGTVILGGTNTYSGATLVAAGAALQPSSFDSLSANSNYTVNGTLNLRQLGGGDFTIKSLSGTGNVTNTLAGNSTLVIATAAAQTATFDGAISDFGGGNPHVGIAINGAGTQKFTQSNNYSGGTTLTAGTLEVANAGALGSGQVTFNGGTLKTDGAYGIGNAIRLDAGGGTIDNGSNAIALSGNITDGTTPALLSLSGGGTTSLTGDNSGFSGGLSVTDGTLALSGPNSAGSGDIAVHNATVAFDAAGSYANNFKLDTAATFAVSDFAPDRVILAGVISDLSGSAGLTLTGNTSGATVELAGANTYSGGTTLDGGIIARIGVDTVGTAGHITSGALGTGTVTVTSGSFQAGGDYALANDINLSTSSAIDANGHAFTLSGLISGTGALYLTDSQGGGSIAMADASNSFLSGVIVNNVTVILTGSSGTGTGPLGTGPVTLNGGTLRADSPGHLDNLMYLDTNGGTLRATSGTYSFGPIADSGVSGALTIGAPGDTGIVSLADGSSYSGGTTIAGGTALVNGATAFGDITQTVVMQTGTTLAYANTAVVSNPLQWTGNVTLGVATGLAEQHGDVSDDSPANPYTVTKTGAGTLLLSGTNSSSANVTLAAGTLEIGSYGALGGGTYTFDGGTLKVDNGWAIGNDFRVLSGGTFDTNGYNVELDGHLSSASTDGVLTITGAGSVLIAGTNNLAGGANIGANTQLSVAGASGLSAADVSMAAGSVIQFTTNNGTFTNHFLLDGDPIFIVDSGLTTTLSGVIADAPSPAIPGVVEKTGAGTLVLSGLNTYSGGTTLTDGILQVGVETVGTPGSITSSAIGTGALTFDGGTLQAGGDYTLANTISLASADGAVDANGRAFTLTGPISGNHGLAFSDSQGGGSITVSGASTYSGDTHINGATVILQAGSSGPSTGPLGAGTIVLDGGTLQAGVNGFLVNAIALDTNGGTLRAGSNSYFFGQISDGTTPGALTVGAAGDTGTVVLAAGSSYTGGTTIAGGVARVTSSDSFGDTNGFVTINDGATVQYDDMVDIANTLILHGAVTLNVATSTDVATQSGDILEDVPSSLEKTGAGTLVLNSGGNYSGATIVSEGTLQLSSSTALPTSTDVEVASGATLAIDGGIAFGVEIGSLGDHAGAGGTVTIGSGTELFVGDGSNANNTTFSGVVTGGDLTYDGAGTLTLTGASNSVEALTICGCVTTGGITLSGGHMDATYRVDVESGALTVQNGAVLEVSGTGFASTGGAVLVTGAGSAIIVHTALAANNDTAVTNFFSASAASQTIAAGGQFTTPGDSYIATDGTPGATATGLVTGAGSVWTADHFFVGSGFLGGNGALTVADGGKVVSTGGITLALGSTLGIGSGGVAGIIDAPTISGGGSNKIVADFTDTSTVSASISGGLTLTKQGSGTLILTGANTYSGVTTINGGTLQVGNGGKLGSGAVVDNGTLAFNTAAPTTLASIVNGSGGLIQQGSGALTLTANDSYTGETNIAANATLKLTGSGRIQSSSVVTDNGVLDISASGGTAIKTLAGNGSVLLGSNTLQFLNGSTTFSGSITDGGAGGSVEFVSGNQILTGINSWTGTTTLGAGATLTVSSPSSLGGGSLIFNNGATLKFAGGGTYTQNADFAQVHAPIYDVGASTVTWSGQITGVGDLAVTGNGGTLVLTNAANSYGGGTEVYGGAALKVDADGELGATATTLQLGDATTTGTLRFGGVFSLNAARTLVLGAGGGGIDTNGNNVTIAQAITGGSLIVTGNGGMLTLASANTYGGGTDVHGGATLAVTADGALGAVATTLKLGDTTTAGTLRFNNAVTLNAARTLVLGAGGATVDTNGNNVGIASTISGGGLTVIGNGGILALTGTNSYGGGTDVHGGATLVVTADGALGTAATTLKLGDATTAGTLRFGSAFALNAARGIVLGAGGGGIDTNGNTVTIAQAITGGGLTKNGAGNLILTGASTFSGPASINAGILSVNGSIASAVVVNSGGTLGGTGTVGATTVASGGTIAPGNSIGTLHVNGNLTLASGSVTAIEISPSTADQIAVSGTAALGGTLAFNQGAGAYTAGTDFKLLTASSVSGVFSSVTGLSVTGLDANVTYSATAVNLTLTTPASNGGGSSGGSSSGGGSSGGGSPSGGGGTVTNSFLFGTYGKTPNQIAAGTGLAAGANTGALYGATGNLVAANLTSVPGALGQMAGDIHASIRGAAIEDSRIIRDAVLGRLDQAGEHAAVWGSAFGGYGSIAGDGNAAALHHDSAGVIAGADMPVSDGIRLGVAAAYSTGRASTSGHLSTASGNNGHLIGYAGWTGGAIDLKLGGDYGWGTAHTARQVAALGQTLAGRQDQRMGQVFADAGYRIDSEHATFEPYAGIAHVEATSGSFAERGGTAALSGGSVTDGLTYGTLGLRAALAGLSLQDIGIAPKIDLGWRHAFDTLKPGQLVSFQDTGTSFTVLGVPLETDAAALQLGFDVTLTPDAKLSLGYDGTFGSRVQNNAVRGAFQWAF
jgi:autotransporter-associated beta strand protein